MNTIRRRPTIRQILIAAACAFGAQAASAQGFAPWAQDPAQTGAMMTTPVAAEHADTMRQGQGEIIGFAPWQGHTMLREMGGAATRMVDASASVFRPWS